MSFVELAKLVGARRAHCTHMYEEWRKWVQFEDIPLERGVGLTALIRIKVSPGAEIGTFAGEVTGWEGVEILYEVSG